MTASQRFPSAVGWPFKFTAMVMVIALALTQSREWNLFGLLVVGSALGFMWWLYIGTHYTVSERGLLVQSGPLRRWVDASLIERVRSTRTTLSAPALSLDRLEITGGFGAVVVSPSDKAGFVRALRQAVPHVIVEVPLR